NVRLLILREVFYFLQIEICHLTYYIIQVFILPENLFQRRVVDITMIRFIMRKRASESYIPIETWKLREQICVNLFPSFYLFSFNPVSTSFQPLNYRVYTLAFANQAEHDVLPPGTNYVIR